MADSDIHTQYLLSAFLAMEPPDHIATLAKNCGDGSISNYVQQFIWAHCINRNDAYGNDSYLKNCLKKLIKEIESIGGDVLDEFYERYTCYMVFVKEDAIVKNNSWVVKCLRFLCSDGHKKLDVPLQCSLNMLQGDTGCALWPSSLFLSEFILSFPEVFARKSCFEVGSGVGLVGICLQHAEASQVILTDGDESTLSNLKDNLQMNKIRITDDKTGLSAVQCIHLPWESAKESELQQFMPDIILGADVIYDPSYIPHLIKLLSKLLDRKKTIDTKQFSTSEGLVPGSTVRAEKVASQNNYLVSSSELTVEAAPMKSISQEMETRPVAFIASVIRNIDTFNCFLDLCQRANLVVKNLTELIRFPSMIPYMKSYKRSDVHLFLLSY